MKKSLFFVAIATLFFASCQKEVTPSDQSTANNDTPCFKASIEQLTPDTKAYIDASNQLVWYDNGKEGDKRVVDKIGIYFSSWNDNKNQSFTLSSGAGTTEGTFTKDFEWNFTPSDATVAFFPWQGTGADKNNVYDDPNDNPDKGPVMYFKLGSEYWSYDNGDMITPLVASISNSTNISFKHAGAAVKLTVNNLVSGTYAAKMSVYGKQITGSFKMNPANAGTEAIVVDGNVDNTKNYLTLNSWKSSGAFSWIFPVPELTTPKLKFEIIDENGVPVWKKSLAAQANDVSRGDILVMPAVSITPYKAFNTMATWGLCGTHNDWNGDTKMVTDGAICIVKSIAFAANAEFKVRNNGAWGTAGTDNFGWSYVNSDKSKNVIDAGGNDHNIKITIAGTYDVIFNSSTSPYGGLGAHEIRVVQNGYPYPLPKESAKIKIDGSFNDWAGVTSESAGNTTVKVVSNADSVFVYVKMTNVAQTIWSNTDGNQYVYALFDLDGNPDNNVDIWENYGDFVMLLYPYGGSSASPAFVTSAASSSKTWQCKPTTSPYTIGNVKLNGTFSEADESGNRDITYEFCIPRDDMPAIPSTDPITITIKGSKISSNVSISRLL